MNYIIAASTDIGLTKSTNQDSYFIQVLTTPMGKMVFAVVCDGMGGLSKGEVASASVVHGFQSWCQQRLPTLCQQGVSDGNIRREWCDIVEQYNQKIQAYAQSKSIHMGTTVTAMLLTQQRYYILNVGDTRAYEIVDTAQVLTRDQTVVAQEVEQGRLTPQQAERDPRRSILLQCVGASDKVCPDLFFGVPKEGAVYMLCTDGFRHEITPEEIHGFLCPSAMLDAEGMKRNMDTLIEYNKQRQERDNITVLTIRTF